MNSGVAPRDGFRWWLGGLLLLALVAVIGIVLLREKPATVEASRAVQRLRSELEFHEGRLLHQGVPFTGFVLEEYADGQLRSRSSVSNGLIEGLSQGWYTNGVLQVAEHFVRGVSHGLRTKFYPSGEKLSVAHIIEGELQGIYERWHDNGQLAERVFLTNGVADGESLAYHADGSLKARVRLDHGKVVEQKFWNPGEVR